LHNWEQRGVWLAIWRTILGELNRKGHLDWSEAFIDGSFASAKKGRRDRKDRAGQGYKVDGGGRWLGIPLEKHLGSASPAEVKLAEITLASISVPNRSRRGRPRQEPQRLIGDKAYDSDPLRRRLKKWGIELIAPHKVNRVRKPTQDGRALRRYRKRWKIERTNAWLANFRHLVVRYDRSLQIHEAFFHIACFMIALRRL
jgi:transposase